jgi:predicted site-specific integrase-resolvase
MGKGKLILGVKAISGFVGVSDRTLGRWLVDGGADFPVYKLGGRWAADSDDLARWMKRRAVAA